MDKKNIFTVIIFVKITNVLYSKIVAVTMQRVNKIKK